MENKPDVLRVKPSQIPKELKAVPQWIGWKLEWNGKKWTKPPYNIRTGRKDDLTNPKTWVDYRTAQRTYRNGGAFDGIGFVFTESDDFMGYDIDGCLNGSGASKQLIHLKETYGLNTYIEKSPSGKGLHVLATGKLPPGGRKKGDHEMYDQARFFTVTGHRLKGAPKEINPQGREFAAIHKAVIAGPTPTPVPEPVPAPIPKKKPNPDEWKKILIKAFDSEHGEKIYALYAGDTSGYPSHSEADLAFCDHLAFWCDGDDYLIDQIFRRSLLMRSKWDAKRGNQTYGERTIQKAISGRNRPADGDCAGAIAPAPLSPRIGVSSINDLLNQKFDHIEHVIGSGVLPVGCGLILAGESEAGKSLLSLQWAIELAMGRHLLEGKLTVPRSRKVLFFQTENIPSMVQARINKMLSGMNLTSIPDNIFFAGQQVRYDVSNSKCVERMVQAIKECEADVYVIDPLSSFHSANENDNGAMRRVLDTFTEISRLTGVASIVIHHYGKPQEGRDNAYRLRGASATKDWCDTLVLLEHETHPFLTVRNLKFQKIRYGVKLNPVMLERDDASLIHKVTSGHMAILPNQIAIHIKNIFKGSAPSKGALVASLVKAFGGSTRTAGRCIDNAVSSGIVKTQKVGNKKSYHV